jgi:hypothetical protein
MAPPLLGAQQLGLSVSTGPAIRLDYTPGESPGNPVASFMYFVPLISLEPVSSLTSPGSTQSAPVTSAKRRFTAHSFFTKCEFEFRGQSSQEKWGQTEDSQW